MQDYIGSGYNTDYAAIVDPDTNKIYLLYIDSDQDIISYVYDGGSWTREVDVAGPGFVGGVALAFDTTNDEVYAFWTASTDAKLYHRSSTDGMNTWGSVSADIYTPGGYAVGFAGNMSSGERVSISYGSTTLNDLFTNDVADPTAPVSVPEFGWIAWMIVLSLGAGGVWYVQSRDKIVT